MNLPFAFGWLLLFSITSVVAPQAQAERGAVIRDEAKTAVGINLAPVADWGSELPFVDVFRSSQPWISQRDGANWGKGPALVLDEHGWVKQLEDGCYAETLMLVHIN